MRQDCLFYHDCRLPCQVCNSKCEKFQLCDQNRLKKWKVEAIKSRDGIFVPLSRAKKIIIQKKEVA